MSNLVRRHSRLLFALVVLALLAVVPTVSMANHSWGGYHWARTSNPFTLKVGDNVTTAWDSYLNTTISDWSQSTVLNLTKVAGTVNPKTCKATAGMIQVCNATYGNNGWLGIAGISITGGTHITQAYTKLNDSYFNTAQYNTPAWRNLVSCQEVGHDFGLDHQDENFSNANLNTCMDYTNNPDSNQHPNSHDYQMLQDIYAHLDSTTTVGAALPPSTPPAMKNIVLNSINDFGPIVKAVKNGAGLATYHVQDFGHGNKVVTHVFWALDSHHEGH
jgi:hypothetical protein